MGIIVSSCKGKSSALKYELVDEPVHTPSRPTPSKRDQRFKTYKTLKTSRSNLVPSTTQHCLSTRLIRSENTADKRYKLESTPIYKCKSLQNLRDFNLIESYPKNKSDKFCQVKLISPKSFHNLDRTSKSVSPCLTTNRRKNRSKTKMSNRKSNQQAQQQAFQHHHYHHHHYHRSPKNKILLAHIDDDEMRISPTISILSDIDADFNRNVSVFSSLYNQGLNFIN